MIELAMRIRIRAAQAGNDFLHSFLLRVLRFGRHGGSIMNLRGQGNSAIPARVEFEVCRVLRASVTTNNDGPRFLSRIATTFSSPVWLARGDCAEHDEYDRHRAVHHNPGADVSAGRAASDARL